MSMPAIDASFPWSSSCRRRSARALARRGCAISPSSHLFVGFRRRGGGADDMVVAGSQASAIRRPRAIRNHRRLPARSLPISDADSRPRRDHAEPPVAYGVAHADPPYFYREALRPPAGSSHVVSRALAIACWAHAGMAAAEPVLCGRPSATRRCSLPPWCSVRPASSTPGASGLSFRRGRRNVSLIAVAWVRVRRQTN